MNVHSKFETSRLLLHKVSERTDGLVCKQNKLHYLHLVLLVQTSPQPEMTSDWK